MTLETGSLNAKQQITAREKDQAVLLLVTIFPPGFPVIRIVNNLENITSNGEVFNAFPVRIDLSIDDGKTMQTVKMTIDNVTLEMIEWLRTVTSPIPVTIQTIFSGSPDIIEQQISDLIIRNIRYNAMTIEATLMADDDLNQKVPSDTFNNYDFPGLY
jgi:AAA+ superfamily predicted ATPase